MDSQLLAGSQALLERPPRQIPLDQTPLCANQELYLPTSSDFLVSAYHFSYALNPVVLESQGIPISRQSSSPKISLAHVHPCTHGQAHIYTYA